MLQAASKCVMLIQRQRTSCNVSALLRAHTVLVGIFYKDVVRQIVLSVHLTSSRQRREERLESPWNTVRNRTAAVLDIPASLFIEWEAAPIRFRSTILSLSSVFCGMDFFARF